MDQLLQVLRQDPGQLQFAEVLAAIDADYAYQPTLFTNGIGEHKLVNEPGMNAGSCRVFGFARLHQLTEQETLLLFAEHYRAVLADPHGSAHANIRMFMRYGWVGLQFDGEPLVARAA